MTDRVIVFLDWQNVYASARRAFHHSWDTYIAGQVDPVLLGQVLAAKNPNQVLTQVRIYRGLPDSSKQPEAYGANERQAASWRRSELVSVHRRPLQYPRGWVSGNSGQDKPREKGIDVALAVDFVRLAIEGAYDVGILMSGDTDLKPALEFVHDYKGSVGPRPEVAAWSRPVDHSPRLSLKGRSLWCHWIDRDAYWAIRDPVTYST